MSGDNPFDENLEDLDGNTPSYGNGDNGNGGEDDFVEDLDDFSVIEDEDLEGEEDEDVLEDEEQQ